MKKIFFLAFFILTGCGPGCADYSEGLWGTGYTFHRTSSIGRQIWPKPNRKCPNVCGSINSIVMGYDYNKHVIAAVRQIRNDYRCDENYLAAEITNNVVFEYIDLSDGSWSGSLPLDALAKLGETEEFRKIDIVRLLSSANHKKPVRALTNCTNPKLVE